MRIARETFGKRALIEGYFAREPVTADTPVDCFAFITSRLGLRTYADPIVHHTSEVVLYTCAEFDTGVNDLRGSPNHDRAAPLIGRLESPPSALPRLRPARREERTPC